MQPPDDQRSESLDDLEVIAVRRPDATALEAATRSRVGDDRSLAVQRHRSGGVTVFGVLGHEFEPCRAARARRDFRCPLPRGPPPR